MRAIHLIGVLAVAALPLAAQQPAKPDTARPHHPMMHGPMPGGMMQGPGMQGHMMQHMMQMQEMMGPMMRAMAFTPDHLLARKDSLGLSAEQVGKLGALRDAAKAAHDKAAADAKSHQDALAKVFAAPAPDTVAARQHFQAAHAAMGSAHWAMLRAAAQARAVLTDSQRGRVEGWVDAMQMMMRQMRERR